MAYQSASSCKSLEARGRTCVYCLQNEEISEDQVLLRGENLYLCAPRGQLLEGYLAISSYSCIGCLAHFPDQYFEELMKFKVVVAAFYRETYRSTANTYYEQGRAGAGARVDMAAGFPLHAHLCSLPATVDLHAILARRHMEVPVRGPEEIAAAAKDRPYVYAEAVDNAGAFRAAVYVGKPNESNEHLEQGRLKLLIAAALNLPCRGNWRVYPGDKELAQVIERFSAFRSELAGRRNDCPIHPETQKTW